MMDDSREAVRHTPRVRSSLPQGVEAIAPCPTPPAPPERQSAYADMPADPDDAARTTELDTEAAWAKCAKDVWAHESGTIARWVEEIDTLLVFAGLFSAVLTAFNVQYYPALQVNTSGSSSQHLPVSTIVINALWFLSLVLSLAAASIGISVKQWLAHYVAPESIAPRQRARIWHLRHRGLMRWHVSEIIALLPLLLQLSLALFLIGIAILLWTLHRVVAGIVMAPIVVLLLFSAGTAIIPAITPDCPYKSPQAWWFYLGLRRLTLYDGIFDKVSDQSLWDFLVRIWRTILPMRDWLDRENQVLHRENQLLGWSSVDEKRCEALARSVEVVVAADHLIRDDKFLINVVRPALQQEELRLDHAVEAFYRLVEGRAHMISPMESADSSKLSSIVWFEDDMDSGSIVALADIALDILFRLHGGVEIVLPQHFEAEYETCRLLNLLHRLFEAMPVLKHSPFRRLVQWLCKQKGKRSVYGYSAIPTETLRVVGSAGAKFGSMISEEPADQRILLAETIMEQLERVSRSNVHVLAGEVIPNALQLLDALIIFTDVSELERDTFRDIYDRLFHMLETSNLPPSIETGIKSILWRFSGRFATPLQVTNQVLMRTANRVHDRALRLAKWLEDDNLRSKFDGAHIALMSEQLEFALEDLLVDFEEVDEPPHYLATILHELLRSVPRVICVAPHFHMLWNRSYARSLLKVSLAVARRQPELISDADFALIEECLMTCLTECRTDQNRDWTEEGMPLLRNLIYLRELVQPINSMSLLHRPPFSRAADDSEESVIETELT